MKVYLLEREFYDLQSDSDVFFKKKTKKKT